MMQHFSPLSAIRAFVQLTAEERAALTLAPGQVWTPADNSIPPRVVLSVSDERLEYQRGRTRAATTPQQFAAWVLQCDATTEGGRP